ncbi:MAG TPA: hypothetical protein VGG03_10020 [Thermoanaerobaculia bacterium]|jgi:hypothetical protein
MRKTCPIHVLALGLGLLGSAAALAAGREAALGSGGEVYTVRAGAYKDLFPGAKDSDRDNRVIALDITQPGGALQRILVPGTGGPEVESSPSVLFEDDSQTIFLLWESEMNFHPSLRLAGFDGSNWSKPIEVTGNAFALKSSPQFAITRDSYEESGPDNLSLTRHRTILHLVWQEPGGAAGTLETLYSPIFFIDGVYIGWNPVYNLDEYLQNRVEGANAQVPPALARAPVVESGRDERTIVIAYASTTLAKLVGIEVDVLPGELIQLADKARSHIVDLGRQLYPHDLPALGEKARSHIVDLGRAFRPEVVNAIADQTKAQILAGGAGSLEALADKARSHIVDLGAQLSGRGLRGDHGADATAKIVQIGSDEPNPPVPLEVIGSHLLQFRVMSSLPVPPASQGSVRLFLSESGENLIASWAQADRVVYRVSRENGWSDAKELKFSNSLNLAKAYEILEQRVRNR